MTGLAVALLRALDRADSVAFALPLLWRPWLATAAAAALLASAGVLLAG